MFKRKAIPTEPKNMYLGASEVVLFAEVCCCRFALGGGCLATMIASANAKREATAATYKIPCQLDKAWALANLDLRTEAC